MAEIKIAAVMRAGVYSPNHLGNDAAIMNAVTEQLRKRGCEVKVYSEERLNNGEVTEDVIVNMCRERRSIDLLQRYEEEGRIVINSGIGIENCSRERMTRILLGNGIPYPKSIIVDTDEALKSRLVKAGFTRCWIKRGDYPMHNEDITYVRNADEAQETVQEYFLRGIKRAVVTQHLEGDLIKFYGVADTSFFYCFNPFLAEARRLPGQPRQPESTFDKEAVRQLCTRAAEALDVKIYGGDCIISPDGTISIIDFNDFPSFASCRQDAASAIAKMVISEVKNRRKGASD